MSTHSTWFYMLGHLTGSHTVVCCCTDVPYCCLYWQAVRHQESLSIVQMESSWSWSATSSHWKLKSYHLIPYSCWLRDASPLFPSLWQNTWLGGRKLYSSSQVQKLQSLAPWFLCLCRTWWWEYVVVEGCSHRSQPGSRVRQEVASCNRALWTYIQWPTSSRWALPPSF